MGRGLNGLVKSYKCGTLPERTKGTKLFQHNLVLVVNFGMIMHVLTYLAKLNIRCSRKTGTFPQVQESSINPRLTEMTFLSGHEVLVGPQWFYSALFAAQNKRLRLEKTRRRYFPHIKQESMVFGKPVNANLVFTAHLPGRFYDIAKFAANTTGVEYEPIDFPGANLTILDANDKPIGKVMAFEGGYINIMGCRSLAQAMYALDVFVKLITPFACEPLVPTSNIVADREKEKHIALRDVVAAIKKTDNSPFAHTLSDHEENLKKLGLKKTVLEMCEEDEEMVID